MFVFGVGVDFDAWAGLKLVSNKSSLKENSRLNCDGSSEHCSECECEFGDRTGDTDTVPDGDLDFDSGEGETTDWRGVARAVTASKQPHTQHIMSVLERRRL